MRRKCLAKQLYETATPYVQLAGWIVIAAPVLYLFFSTYKTIQDNKVQADEFRAFKPAMQQQLAVMSQKIDDIWSIEKEQRHGR